MIRRGNSAPKDTCGAPPGAASVSRTDEPNCAATIDSRSFRTNLVHLRANDPSALPRARSGRPIRWTPPLTSTRATRHSGPMSWERSTTIPLDGSANIWTRAASVSRGHPEMSPDETFAATFRERLERSGLSEGPGLESTHVYEPRGGCRDDRRRSEGLAAPRAGQSSRLRDPPRAGARRHGRGLPGPQPPDGTRRGPQGHRACTSSSAPA